MTDSPSQRLARALRSAGTDMAFGVPGGGPNLDVVGAMQAEGIRFILSHGETPACIMASTYGQITGRVSPVVVTRGPGAAVAVNGAAQATLDRQPLVLITDTVPAATTERVAHQRIDQRALFASVTVGAVTLGDATTDEDLAAVISTASTWPHGAVHVDYDPAGGGPASLRHNTGAGSADTSGISQAIAVATRPIILLGVGAVGAASELRPVLESFGAPILSTYQATGIIGSEHPLCGGLFTNGASERPLIDQADLIIAIGLDMVEPIPAPWTYSAPVVSLAPSPTADPYMPIGHEAVGDVGLLTAEVLTAEVLTGAHSWTADAGAVHRESVRSQLHAEPLELGPVDLVKAVAECAPATLTTTVDAGAHFLAIMPFWSVTEPNRLLISNGLATMGYSVPAAIGAALARPGEPVLSFVGDGGLGMVLAELETIARLDLPITVVVFNDAALSLIEIKQTDAAHGGKDAVDYAFTDFSTVAGAMGLESRIVHTTDEVKAALGTDWSKPRLIDARIDPSPYKHLIGVTRGG
jgi:acetolactate synthase-1/2/3 large subunit